MEGGKASEGNSFQRFQWIKGQREGLLLAGDVEQKECFVYILRWEILDLVFLLTEELREECNDHEWYWDKDNTRVLGGRIQRTNKSPLTGTRTMFPF